MKIKLGMSPISWSNDDLPELGGDTPLETCLKETRMAGYIGTETGGKFPSDKNALSGVLKQHDLQLVSGWYSGQLAHISAQQEIKNIQARLDLFNDLGADVLVYGETWQTVQNVRHAPLVSKPYIANMPEYGEKLTQVAEYCKSEGVPLSFHHHMGTAVETENELDQLMQNTGNAVGLLVDTGHLVFAGGDLLGVVKKYGARINHVHTKDIREDILAKVDRQNDSFLDCVLAGVFTVPGDGMIDYHAFLQALADHKYEGWVIVEAEQDPAKANPYQYACMGHQALTQAAQAAGYSIAQS